MVAILPIILKLSAHQSSLDSPTLVGPAREAAILATCTAAAYAFHRQVITLLIRQNFPVVSVKLNSFENWGAVNDRASRPENGSGSRNFNGSRSSHDAARIDRLLVVFEVPAGQKSSLEEFLRATDHGFWFLVWPACKFWRCVRYSRCAFSGDKTRREPNAFPASLS